MAGSGLRYRKLPGRRRGFISSASLWIGEDHVLSVKSGRLQESYKRFYYRDIQAIVATSTSRFTVSTWMAGLGIVMLIGILIAQVRWPAVTILLWLLAGVLIAVWAYISAAHSCTCRLYTAVSREDLPSIYRTWTARRVLAELEPRIAEAQGVFTESWVEAADARSPGPSGAPAGLRLAHASRRTLASDLFVGCLFAEALATVFEINSPGPLATVLSAVPIVLQLGSGIWIFVQHHRGILGPAMQRLAIAALVFVGVLFYAASLQMAITGQRGPFAFQTYRRVLDIRPIYAIGTLVLGMAGLVLSFKSFEGEQPPAITR